MKTQEAFASQNQAAAWAGELYANGVDKMDAVKFASVFTDDAWLRFGNAEPVIGRHTIETAIAGFFSMINGLSHETTGTWYNDDALILEANVTYDKKDGSRVSVPAVTIMRLSRSSDDSAEP
ncbi:MAG TPA: nuclear transport factor 2 family protein, partial [Gemmatimonadaceae bacterium]|nr:nuclear transport factor 2 family protein [Gemmatimonadaceae bacterium]